MWRAHVLPDWVRFTVWNAAGPARAEAAGPNAEASGPTADPPKIMNFAV